jgi:hypothetical protein
MSDQFDHGDTTLKTELTIRNKKSTKQSLRECLQLWKRWTKTLGVDSKRINKEGKNNEIEKEDKSKAKKHENLFIY